MNTETTGAAAAPEGAVAPAPETSAAVPEPAELKWPTIELTLSRALPGGITKLVIAEPDLEALERLEAAGLDLNPNDDKPLTIRQLRPIIGALTGIPDEALKRMALKDVYAFSELLGPLLEGATT